jgi:hypothetical protein
MTESDVDELYATVKKDFESVDDRIKEAFLLVTFSHAPYLSVRTDRG